MVITPIYNEFIDFLAGGFTPQQIIDYKPSNGLKQKLFDMLDKEKSGELTLNERSELNYYLQLEHIIRLAKARARKHLK